LQKSEIPPLLKESEIPLSLTQNATSPSIFDLEVATYDWYRNYSVKKVVFFDFDSGLRLPANIFQILAIFVEIPLIQNVHFQYLTAYKSKTIHNKPVG
jgi:hypothetical protein